jgi:hypothetical protein
MENRSKKPDKDNFSLDKKLKDMYTPKKSGFPTYLAKTPKQMENELEKLGLYHKEKSGLQDDFDNAFSLFNNIKSDGSLGRYEVPPSKWYELISPGPSMSELVKECLDRLTEEIESTVIAGKAGLIKNGEIQGIPEEKLASVARTAKYVNENDPPSFWRFKRKLESGSYFKRK